MKAECQLFHYASTERIDEILFRILMPIMLAKPLVRERTMIMSFVRSFLVESVRNTLRPFSHAHVGVRSAYLREFTRYRVQVITAAYSIANHEASQLKALRLAEESADSPDDARWADVQRLKNVASQNTEGKLSLSALNRIKMPRSRDFCNPHGVQQLVTDKRNGSIGVDSPAARATFFCRDEDLDFMNLFVEKSSLEFMFYYSRFVAQTLLPSEIMAPGAAAMNKASEFNSFSFTSEDDLNDMAPKDDYLGSGDKN